MVGERWPAREIGPAGHTEQGPLRGREGERKEGTEKPGPRPRDGERNQRVRQGGKERRQRPGNEEAQLGLRNQMRKGGKNNETWVQILTSLGFSLLNSEIKERISSSRVC